MITHAQRNFQGPFLILGITPTWPAELNTRKENGHLFQLSSLFPVKALQPGVVDVAPVHERREKPPSPARVAVPRIVEKLGPWAQRVERQARDVKESVLLELLALLDRPRTAKQVARGMGVSRPTVDYYLRALQMQVGAALEVGKRGRARTFWVRRASS